MLMMVVVSFTNIITLHTERNGVWKGILICVFLSTNATLVCVLSEYIKFEVSFFVRLQLFRQWRIGRREILRDGIHIGPGIVFSPLEASIISKKNVLHYFKNGTRCSHSYNGTYGRRIGTRMRSIE